MKNYGLALLFLIGIAIGVAAMVYGPDYVKPFLPKTGAEAMGGVEGEVISKLKEQNRLLVTVKTAEGSILVTFAKKVPEIDLLVQEGDIVNLGIRNYRPFINDPAINRVRKPDQKVMPTPVPMPEPEAMKEEEKPAKAKPEAVKPEPEKKEQKKVEPAKAEPMVEEKPAEAEAPAPEETAPVTNSTM